MIAMERREKKQKTKKKSLFVLMKSKGKTFEAFLLDLSITDCKSVTLLSQKAMIVYNVNKRILYCLCFNSY